eukprot:c56023_g1_i1 orf=17-217(-)
MESGMRRVNCLFNLPAYYPTAEGNAHLGFGGSLHIACSSLSGHKGSKRKQLNLLYLGNTFLVVQIC